MTLVQAWVNADAGAGNTTVTATLGSNPTAGSEVVICASNNGAGKTLNTPSDTFGDSGGTSWSLKTNSSFGGALDVSMYIWTRIIGSGPSGKTATVTGTNGGIEVSVGEYSSPDSSGAIDGSATSGSGASGVPTPSAAITTTVASDVIIGYVSKTSGAFTAGTGYTKQITNTSYNSNAVEDQITTVTGNYTPDWATSGSAWGTIAIALKGASASTGAGRLVGGSLVNGSLVGSLA